MKQNFRLHQNSEVSGLRDVASSVSGGLLKSARNFSMGVAKEYELEMADNAGVDRVSPQFRRGKY